MPLVSRGGGLEGFYRDSIRNFTNWYTLKLFAQPENTTGKDQMSVTDEACNEPLTVKQWSHTHENSITYFRCFFLNCHFFKRFQMLAGCIEFEVLSRTGACHAYLASLDVRES